MYEISHLSVCKDVLKLGQHYQFPNTNVLSDLIIELQVSGEQKKQPDPENMSDRERRTNTGRRDKETRKD